MAILTIAYSCKEVDGKILLSNSENDHICTASPKDLLEFLARNYSDGLNRKMTWNLDAFIAPILKLLGLEVCKELVKEPDCECLWEFTDNGIQLHDVKNKPNPFPKGLFSLYYHRQTSLGLQVYGERKSYFYNLSQFFESEEEIDDCKRILAKAKELVDAFFSMGLNPLKMSSPISVYQSNVLEKIDFPTLADLPSSLAEKDCDLLANWAEDVISRSEWTTCLAVGNWNKGESFDFDIQSAYGWAFSELKSFKYAKFIKSAVSNKDADWGLLKGRVTINAGVKCSPIPYRKENGQTIYPVGCSWEDVFTLPDIRWIYRYKIGTFELQDGIFWKYTAPVQPFKVSMERIFNQRQQGGLVKKLAKRIGASAWAKSIQKSTSEGGNPFYSPILALQVKTNCRLAVADFIYNNNLQDSVLHIGTDGIRASKQVKIPEIVKMGAWKFSGDGECIILSPGVIYSGEHKPGGLYYKDVVDLITKSPNESYYATKKTRHLTLGEAIDMGHLDKVGELMEFQTSVDLMDARLRQDLRFDDFPQNGKELLGKKYYGIYTRMTRNEG